jgi:iron complex outermembrane receptor protein
MRRMLFWGTAASSILAVAPAPAQTPDTLPAPNQAKSPSPAESAPLEEVVVSGVRRSLENAINTKRDADVVVDAISAEDVGKFPTENVAESLQRVTGVQISRFRGEGQNVTIRGLPTDFTLVELNGHTLANALGASGTNISRSFDFTILPSEFVSKVEVFKTPSADMEEGGLAGTVIARTVRPLDIGRRKITANIEEANESNRDMWAPRASAFYTDVFADGMLGISLGGAYTKRLTETHEQSITRYRRLPESALGGLDLNGNGKIDKTDPTRYAVLDSIFQELFRENRTRKTGTATIQFRPDDHFDFLVDGFYGKMDLFSPRLTDLIRIGIGLKPGGPVVPGTQVLDQRPGNSSAVGDKGQPVNMLESAEFQGVDQRGDGRTESRSADLLSIGLTSTYRSDNELKVTNELSMSRARQVMDNPLEENQRKQGLGYADVGYDLRKSSDLVSYYFGGNDAASRLDPSTYQLLSLNGEWGSRRKDDQHDASLDVQKGLHWGPLDSVMAGGRFSVRSVFQDNRRIAGTSAQLAGLFNINDPANLFLVPVHPSSGNFLGAAGNTSGLFPQTWLVNDPFAFINHFGRAALEAHSTITNDPTGIYDVKERVGAGYIRANLVALDNKLTGNIGIRFVHTTQISKGVAPDLNGITFEPQAGSITRVPAAGPLTVERTYNDILPSLNLKYDVLDDLIVRFAASRTMSRPTLTQLSPTLSAAGPSQSLTANNPYLDPFRANNLDLAGEWYFAPGGLVSMTLFWKDIVSQVLRQNSQIPLTITQINGDGSRTPTQQVWTLSSLVNGPGTHVTGAELSYQQNFDFLPWPLDGLGVLGNYTYLHQGNGQPLQGASKNNYTASLYYEKGWFGGRLTYTYRGKFYVSTEANTQDQVWEQPFGTLDANVTFNIGQHVALVFEATNILEDTNRRRYEPIDLTADYVDNGRRILVGARATF